MKLILTLFVIITVAMMIDSDAKAVTLSSSNCKNFDSCFNAKHKQLLQTKYRHYQHYPQFAYRNRADSGKYKSYPLAVYGKRFPGRIHPRGHRIFVFSPRIQRWAAYDSEGFMVARGRANGGSGYCADLGRACRTPRGVFRVYSRGDINCKSSKFPRPYGGAPMPYCMFFRGGYAIHGSPTLSNVNNSHGCIRVKTSAARWLHQNFLFPGTRVMVLSY